MYLEQFWGQSLENITDIFVDYFVNNFGDKFRDSFGDNLWDNFVEMFVDSFVDNLGVNLSGSCQAFIIYCTVRNLGFCSCTLVNMFVDFTLWKLLST